MRHDMAKVIVERPRLRFPLKNGSAYPRGARKNEWHPELEEAPKRGAYGSRRYAQKLSNENLQPLVRFLRSSVGRPWNKVHSEIAERLSVRSAVQKHVMDHLKELVAEHVVRRGQDVFRRGGSSCGARHLPLRSHGMRLEFYVDPACGLLRLAPFAPRETKASR